MCLALMVFMLLWRVWPCARSRRPSLDCGALALCLHANLMGNCDLVPFHLTGHHLMIDLEVGVEVNLHHCAHRGDISLSCSAMCA
jgi:hypothetical protein